MRCFERDLERGGDKTAKSEHQKGKKKTHFKSGRRKNMYPIDNNKC